MRRGMVLILLAVAPVGALGADDADRQRKLLQQLAVLEEAIERGHGQLKEAEGALLDRRLALQEVSADAQRAADRHELARKRLIEARKHEKEVFISLKDRFKSDPKVLAARKQLTAAQDELKKERARVLEPVHKTAEYRKASHALEEAEAKVKAARAEGDATREEILRLASASLDCRNAVAAIENEALEADEQYDEVLARVKETRAALGEVNRQIADLIRVSEDRMAAIEALERAKDEESVAERESDRLGRQLRAVRIEYARADAVRETIRRQLENDTQLQQQYQAQLSSTGGR